MLAHVDGMLVPIPINLTTINRLYGLTLGPDEVRGVPRQPRRSRSRTIRTSEDVVVSRVGRELYEKFFRGYTRKQWGIDPSRARQERDAARADPHQHGRPLLHRQLPEHAAARLHAHVREHARPSRTSRSCSTPTSTRSRARSSTIELIFTGPIDEYFDYRYGELPYRSLRFEHKTLDQPNFQPVAVVNYPDESVPYTRVTEYKHLTGQQHAKTSLTYEYPGGGRRPLLPGAAARERRAVPQVPEAGRPDAGRPLRRPARDLPLLQHGPGRRAGAGPLRQARPATGTGRRPSGATVAGHVAKATLSGARQSSAPMAATATRAAAAPIAGEDGDRPGPTSFASFFAGGFECSAHRRRDGRRLDLIAATGHDAHAARDYRRLRRARDAHGPRRPALAPDRGAAPGRYDWSSFLPMLRAARDTGVQVIWDLCHYGYPDGLDIWGAAFVDRFARFAAAAARVVRDETDEVPFYCPMNEISFWAWAGATVAKFNPGSRRRGPRAEAAARPRRDRGHRGGAGRRPARAVPARRAR